MKKQRGITLIALVITIILMLILAAVVVKLSLGENGIFERAKRAKIEHIRAKLEEELQIKYSNDILQADGVAVDFNTFVNELKEEGYAIPENNEPYTITKEGYTFSLAFIDNNISVRIIDESEQQAGEEAVIVGARYLIVEVDGFLEGEDCAVINELEVYDSNNQKINYTVLNSLVYDSVKDGNPNYWNNANYWNYTNLNDENIQYESNSMGSSNCTLFLYNGSEIGSTNSWARFIIDLGENKQVGDTKLYEGGIDELSPNEGRMPKTINVYKVGNFIDGDFSNSTYIKNICQKNNKGLQLIRTKTFDSNPGVATEYIMQNTNSPMIVDDTEDIAISARYLIIEADGILQGEDCAVINELEVYDSNNQKTNYTVLTDLEYDSCRSGYSTYWTDMRYWNYTNLYDGEIEYLSNYPSGNSNGTIVVDGNGWGRFVIDLGEFKQIRDVIVYVGGYDELSSNGGRVPSTINVYKVNSFVDGTGANTTYSNNITQKNNTGLDLIRTKTFTSNPGIATRYFLR